MTEREEEALTITCFYCINKFYLYAQYLTKSVLVLFPKMFNKHKGEKKKDKKENFDLHTKQQIITLVKHILFVLPSLHILQWHITSVCIAQSAFPMYSRAYICKRV